jgi:hypothetical protein
MSATEAVRAATAKCGSDPRNVERLGGALDDYSDTALNRTLQDISDADAEAPSEIEAARLQYFARRIHALGERALFVSELATGANLTCGDVSGIGRAPR